MSSDHTSEIVPTQKQYLMDQFRKDLVVFKDGVGYLKNGSELLRQILQPNFMEQTISLFAPKIADRMRSKRLMAIDLEKSHQRLLSKTKEVINSLNRLIDDLEKRWIEASKTTETLPRNLMELMKKEEDLSEKLKQLQEDIRSIEKDYKQASADNIIKMQYLEKLASLKRKQNELILQLDEVKSRVNNYKRALEVSAIHADLSFNILSKLRPIKNTLESNAELLHNKMDMLNKSISAGAMLRPIIQLATDIEHVSIQFTEAEIQIHEVFKDIEKVF